MKILLLLVGLSLFGASTLYSQAPAVEIDWNKAQQLFQREQRGEKLPAAEQAYLDHAKEVRRTRGGGGGSQGMILRTRPERQTPLSDMTVEDRYEGEDGGLYGGGKNTPPETLRKEAEKQLALIRPLDSDGKDAAVGKIGLVSISMSNATMEFSAFKRLADAGSAKSEKVTVIDCAQGGQTMERWAQAESQPWTEAMRRLEAAGVSSNQVQVAWIKLANGGPRGTLLQHGKKLEADTVAVLHNAKARFPNLRIAYLGSRIWGGNSTGQLNPEPYAYEGAFVVRWLIQRQMKGDAELAEGKSPLLLWGPYLWAEGEKGRKMDELIWKPEDFIADGVHPSESGRQKVAKLLLDFFSTDPLAKSWFAK